MIEFLFSNLFFLILVIYGIISFLRKTGILDARRQAERPFSMEEHQERIPHPIPLRRDHTSLPVHTAGTTKTRTLKSYSSSEGVGGIEGVGGSNWTQPEDKGVSVSSELPDYPTHTEGAFSHAAREGMKWAIVFDKPRALKPYNSSYRIKK